MIRKPGYLGMITQSLSFKYNQCLKLYTLNLSIEVLISSYPYMVVSWITFIEV